MGKTKSTSNDIQPSGHSGALVALYLTQETGLPCNAKDYELSIFMAPDSTGNLVARQALRVTFDKNTSVEQPRHLLTFGSDEKRCNVILMASEAKPVHCRVYAQLNSGPDVWVVEDSSSDGTEYLDHQSLRNFIPKQVVGGRFAAQGLRRIKIGRNIFSLWPPSDSQEISRRERWLQDHNPTLVTQKLLREQLRGAVENYCPIRRIGHGGMGDVLQYMEKTTGLMIAVKEEEVRSKEADERVQKEIGYMRILKHVSQMTHYQQPLINPVQPNLVEYITSNPATNSGIKKWFTAMPLYQGCLCDVLPLEISAIENVMLQLFEGVAYMHAQRILHKDIKPDNVLVKRKSGPDVVLADYGLCASLNNQAELMTDAGTLGFAAPEISRMIVQTEAVDVFALGATLFFILEPERCKGQRATVATLGNVMRRPPGVYAGLVQSMMAHDAQERPSLTECFNVVKARFRDWRKRTPLARQFPPVPSTLAPRRSLRIQQARVKESSILDRDYLEGRKRTPVPIAAYRQPQKRPGLQQTPQRDFKAWDPFGKLQRPKALIAAPAPLREPQAPTPVQHVNFAAPPPSNPDSPFANLRQDPAPNVAPPARRQASPAAHERTRTPIRKPDSETKRKIRRGPERRNMIERFHRIAVQKDNFCRAAGELAAAKTPLNLFRGLHHITAGGLGITAHSLGLIFCDLKAARLALNHIAPAQAKRWGLNTDKRLMYGLKTHKRIYWPMTQEEYEAERLQSKLDFENTSEGRRVRARLE